MTLDRDARAAEIADVFKRAGVETRAERTSRMCIRLWYTNVPIEKKLHFDPISGIARCEERGRAVVRPPPRGGRPGWTAP